MSTQVILTNSETCSSYETATFSVLGGFFCTAEGGHSVERTLVKNINSNMGCLSSKETPIPEKKQLTMTSPKTSNATKVNETKIINLAKNIRNLAKPAGETKTNKSSDDVTEKVSNSFKEIIELAKKCTALDGSVLNEVLMACNALRINNPDLAHKMLYLSQTSKKLVEERTAATEEVDTPGESVTSAFGSLKTIPKAAPAIYVTQVPRENSSTSSNLRLQKLTSDGLPPLKDFKKAKSDYADGSQHSGDFGFFDLSVHDRTGMPEWTGIRPPEMVDASPKMPKKMVYSVSQLNVAGIQ